MADEKITGADSGTTPRSVEDGRPSGRSAPATDPVAAPDHDAADRTRRRARLRRAAGALADLLIADLLANPPEPSKPEGKP